jgi:hypothetical protein
MCDRCYGALVRFALHTIHRPACPPGRILQRRVALSFTQHKTHTLGAMPLIGTRGWARGSRFVELRREAEHELILENIFILKRQKPQPRYVKLDSQPPPPLDVRDPRCALAPRVWLRSVWPHVFSHLTGGRRGCGGGRGGSGCFAVVRGACGPDDDRAAQCRRAARPGVCSLCVCRCES